MARPAVLYVFPLIHPITYFDLSRELVDPASSIRWCQTMKLLPSSKLCTCGTTMHLVKRKDSPEKMGWLCPRKNCRKEITLRRGTFFEGKLIGVTVSNIKRCCYIYVGSH